MLVGPRRTPVLLATLFAVLAAVLVATLGAGAPAANAEPDVETAQKKVRELDRQAEEASERYNEARVKLEEARTRLSAVNADLARQEKRVGALRDQVAAMVVDQYQGATISMTSQVVLSEDPDAFLDNLSAITAYNSQRGQAMDEFSAELSRLELRKTAVRDEADRLRSIERDLLAEKQDLQDKVAKAEEVLDGLQVDERTEVVAAAAGPGYSGKLPKVPASGRASAAVDYAMAQVGKSYGYGAAGPSAFDCSGLTMRAWGAAGVALPHSSSAQMGYGTPVSESQLQPGDLVFYYSPVSHVGMYIGNGLIVNAENPRTGVRVTGLHSMPYVGAVRPG